MSKKITVAFAISDNYTEYLGVSLYSLLKNNPDNTFDVHVLSSDISQANKQTVLLLKKQFKNASIHFVTPDNSIFESLPITIDHITKETYYRYVLADILPKTDKALYLDVDLMVLGDVRPLWETALDDDYAAGAIDGFVTYGAEEFYDTKRYSSYKQSIGFDAKDPYVNAGVLLFNLAAIRRDGMVATLLENTVKLKNAIQFQDQDIINMTFKGRVTLFSNVYNFTERDMLRGELDKATAKIVHFNGPSKPWRKDRHAPEFAKYFNDIYLEYFDEYRQLIRTLKMNGKEEIKYGLFSYATDNIGDEIQSIAARRFLPRVDYYLDRDNIDGLEVQPREKVKVIMNGWYSHKPELFPPDSPNIDPLLISMYISDHVKERFGSDRSRHFLNAHGPVGARNTDTKDYFDQIGVSSYFSGCLTLTIQKSPHIKKRNFILAVDVPERALTILREKSTLPVLDMGAYITTDAMTTEERFALAELYLYLYQSAQCVVTTRLHATLPCLALETPVLNLEKENFEPGRFAGLRELAHHMTVKEYIKNPDAYNVNTPPKNPRAYLKLRNKLIDTCKEFTGYVNDDGFLSIEVDDLLSSVTIMQPFMTGLMSNYELNYIRKVIDNRVNMANSSIEEANVIVALRQELADTRSQLDALQSSKAWRWASKARRAKGKLTDIKDRLR